MPGSDLQSQYRVTVSGLYLSIGTFRLFSYSSERLAGPPWSSAGEREAKYQTSGSLKQGNSGDSRHRTSKRPS